MNNKQNIKVGYLVSYDYQLMEYSLPTVYQCSDQIYLAIDKNRKTWRGNTYELPNTFFEWIKGVDKENKIHIYEDSFYFSNISPMELETRERNLLANFMGSGGWHIQIDVDEYFLDFKGFVNSLNLLDNSSPATIYAKWITIFKQDITGFYYIEADEEFPIATNSPFYTQARHTDQNVKKLIFDFDVLHQSWGRSKEDLVFKLENWGHSNNIDWKAYLDFWQLINKDNYGDVKNIHPLFPPLWPNLKYINVDNISLLIERMR